MRRRGSRPRPCSPMRSAAAEIHGVRTNRDLLVNVLRHPGLPARSDRHGVFRHPRSGGAGRTDRQTRRGTAGLSAIAAALADAAHNRSTAPVLGAAPSGWRNLASGYQTKHYEDPAGQDPTMSGTASPGPAPPPRHVAGDDDIALVSATPTLVVLTVDGVDRPFAVARYRDSVVVDSPERLGAPRRAASLPGSRRRTRPRFAARAPAGIRAARRGRCRRRGDRGTAAGLAGGDEDGTHHHRAPQTACSSNSMSNPASRSRSARSSPG